MVSTCIIVIIVVINLLNSFRPMVRTRSRRGGPDNHSTDTSDTTSAFSASEGCSRPSGDVGWKQCDNCDTFCASEGCSRPSGDVGWIQCDNCDTWLHNDCVGVSKEAAPNIDFICDNCKTELNRSRRQICPDCNRLVTVKANKQFHTHGPINNRCPGTGKNTTHDTDKRHELDFENFQTTDFIDFLTKFQCPTVKFVPKFARVNFASTFAVCIKEVVTNPESKEAWGRYLIMPSCCLRKPTRAGKQVRASLGSTIQQQINAFNRKEYTCLLQSRRNQQALGTTTTPK